MWVAFVFSDPKAKYFIEGDDLEDAIKILWATFGKVPIHNYVNDDIAVQEYLTTLLGIFNITDSVFTEHHTNPMYFKKSKKEIPLMQKNIVRAQDGEYCRMCKDFYSMAVSNQQDGTLVCWACRDSNRWMFR